MDWPLTELCAAIASKIPGFSAEVLPSIDSTNSELMRRSKNGFLEPLLLIAEEQTAGKGRLGRVWFANPGDCLTFSIGLNLSIQDWSGFSLAVGLGILQALDPHQHFGVGLKWPNDLWLGLGDPHTARKLGGILIESAVSTAPSGAVPHSRYCVIGVGINLVAPQGVDLKRAAAGWCDVDPKSRPGSVLLSAVSGIIKGVMRFQERGFSSFKNEYSAYDILFNQQVSMSNGVVGRACGVNSRGELLIQTSAGVVPVISDEVSLVELGGFESDLKLRPDSE